MLAEKQILRQQVLAARCQMAPAEVAEKSKRIIERLLELPQYTKANTILTYVDFRNEVLTGHFITQALQAGKRITVPLVNRSEKLIIPCAVENFPGDLVPGTYGIKEPAPDKVRPVPVEEIDQVIVPGVVFDEKGQRLGYGGGYYDRLLPRLRQGASKVALAFELQVCRDLTPLLDHHDQPVDMIITEDRIIKVAQKV